jgi:hypothetical protein
MHKATIDLALDGGSCGHVSPLDAKDKLVDG